MSPLRRMRWPTRQLSKMCVAINKVLSKCVAVYKVLPGGKTPLFRSRS